MPPRVLSKLPFSLGANAKRAASLSVRPVSARLCTSLVENVATVMLHRVSSRFDWALAQGALLVLVGESVVRRPPLVLEAGLNGRTDQSFRRNPDYLGNTTEVELVSWIAPFCTVRGGSVLWVAVSWASQHRREGQQAPIAEPTLAGQTRMREER